MFRFLRSVYLELPIRIKLQIWFMPLLIFTAGCIGFISYSTASNQVLEKIRQSQQNISSQTIAHLDYLARDIYDINNYLWLSSELHDLFSPNENFSSSGVVYPMINRLMITRQYFQTLLIYSDTHQTIKFNSINTNDIMEYEEFKKSEYYTKTLANVGEGTWGVETKAFKLFVGDESREVFYSKMLTNPGTMAIEGLMIIGMNEENFRKSYSSSQNENIEIIILNQDGTVLSDSNDAWSGRSFNDLPYYDHIPFGQVNWSSNNQDWIVAHSESKETGWHTLVIQPRSEELQQLNKIRWLTFGLVLVILLINIPVGWYISKLFSQPLMRILKSMRELQMGDFNQKVEIDLKDEIGQLGNGYNIMVMRIRELIQNVYESELSKKESELRLLQSQINPHFLYNTLNNISWLLHRDGSPETAEMIQKMSDFFRFSLNQGADIITLDKELKIIEDYLFLSKIRFGNKLTYSIETDEHLKAMYIPKLILQPLVENAIVHGIEPMEGQGFVNIAIHQMEDEVIIVITDNGMGIQGELLEQLNSGIKTKKTSGKSDGIHSFALINVRDRITNHFGAQSIIEISSKLTFGTTITVRFPKKEEPLNA
ncbi:cache domain-containing sensor histidine kinase [Paenibacillus psychroresistens]|nr:sensor histidine kinase [Paenibacillus psychroresistens]